jgi:hypothetical protein
MNTHEQAATWLQRFITGENSERMMLDAFDLIQDLLNENARLRGGDTVDILPGQERDSVTR